MFFSFLSFLLGESDVYTNTEYHVAIDVCSILPWSTCQCVCHLYIDYVRDGAYLCAIPRRCFVEEEKGNMAVRNYLERGRKGEPSSRTIKHAWRFANPGDGDSVGVSRWREESQDDGALVGHFGGHPWTYRV